MLRQFRFLFATLFVLATGNMVSAATPKPLRQAHAHNDYAHKRPLLDALDHGFCSVEADVFLIDGKLLVAHDRKDVRVDRTLEALYLDPLRARVGKNGGRVFPGGPRFHLLIDFKSEGKTTYAALEKVLAKYRDMLSRVEDGKLVDQAVRITISGNRPKEQIAASNPRYAGIDGRMGDLSSDMPNHLMPLISDNWGNHFKWRGEGKFSAAERTKLRAAVRQAHQRGRAIRFWAIPDRPELWKELSEAGVDQINTDKLAELQAFLLRQQADR